MGSDQAPHRLAVRRYLAALEPRRSQPPLSNRTIGLGWGGERRRSAAHPNPPPPRGREPESDTANGPGENLTFSAARHFGMKTPHRGQPGRAPRPGRRGKRMSGSSARLAGDTDKVSRGFGLLVLVLAGYLGVHLLLRLALSPSLIPDEAEVALFSQSLAWGYSEQPPLYSWLVWGVVRLLGLSVFNLTLVRMLVLAAVPRALYATARVVVRDRRLVRPGVASL